MGTRADFYIQKEEEMKWIGSIALDGYPGGIDDEVLRATTEDDYLSSLQSFLEERDDVTLPDEGWPWPWKDSNTSDYAYCFTEQMVLSSCFGRNWQKATDELESDFWDEEADMPNAKYKDYGEPNFPDMSAIKNVKLGGKGSGLIVIGG